MKTVQKTYILILIGLLSINRVVGQANVDIDILVLFVDTVKGECGYKTLEGDVIIPSGKYSNCYTDTFKTYAIVAITHSGKIGYADSATGKISIKPQYDCATKFENGVAKVSKDCQEKSDGEHSTWLSESWFYIDRTGKRVNPIMTK